MIRLWTSSLFPKAPHLSLETESQSYIKQTPKSSSGILPANGDAEGTSSWLFFLFSLSTSIRLTSLNTESLYLFLQNNNKTVLNYYGHTFVKHRTPFWTTESSMNGTMTIQQPSRPWTRQTSHWLTVSSTDTITSLGWRAPYWPSSTTESIHEHTSFAGIGLIS